MTTRLEVSVQSNTSARGAMDGNYQMVLRSGRRVDGMRKRRLAKVNLTRAQVISVPWWASFNGRGGSAVRLRSGSAPETVPDDVRADCLRLLGPPMIGDFRSIVRMNGGFRNRTALGNHHETVACDQDPLDGKTARFVTEAGTKIDMAVFAGPPTLVANEARQ